MLSYDGNENKNVITTPILIFDYDECRVENAHLNLKQTIVLSISKHLLFLFLFQNI